MSDDGTVSTTGSCFKVLLIWCAPSIVVPFLMLLTGPLWPLGAFISIAFLVTMGKSFTGITDEATDAEKTSARVMVVTYVVLQIIWIPLFLLGAILSACALSGSGNI